MGRGDVHDDEHQMRVFYDREYPRVFGAVAMYVGDASLAENIAQEALSRWSKMLDFDRPGAYVHRIAINLANAHFRRRRIARRVQRRLGSVDDVHWDSDAGDAVAVAVEVPTEGRR